MAGPPIAYMQKRVKIRLWKLDGLRNIIDFVRQCGACAFSFLLALFKHISKEI